MQSSLWKLGALFGVIGIGFLVLMKAQTGMTRDDSDDPSEEFSEVAAIEELENLARPASTGDELVPDENPSLPNDWFGNTEGVTGIRGGSTETESTTIDESAREGIQPTLAATPEPTLSPTSDPSSTSAADEVSRNPFQPFESASSSGAPPQSEPAADPDSEPAPAPPTQQNPFLNLVNSLTDSSEAPSENPAPNDSAAVETELVDSSTDMQDGFNPFAAGPVGPSDAETVDEPTSAEPPSVATRLPQGDDPATQGESSTEQTGTLTSLPADQPGPVLMPPPSFSSPDEPASSETPALPAQPAEPAVYEIADADSGGSGEIVPVDAEQSADMELQPNPFLVFPGEENFDRSAEAGPEPAPTEPASSAEPRAEPIGFSTVPAMSEGASRQDPSSPLSPPRGEIVHSDGTIEMTIKPRDRQEPDIVPTQYEEQNAVPAADPFNPFPGNPESATPINANAPQTGVAIQPRPSPGHLEQGRPQGTPQVPGVGSPDAAPATPHSLTRADYIGVGTVSAETPSTPQQAQLTIQKQAPGDAVLGQDLIYSILVKNIGSSPANNVVVQDLVPKGSELKGTDPQAQMTADKKLVWQLGTMDPGAERTIRIKVVPIKAGQIGSVATVTFEAAVASRTNVMAPELRLEMQGPHEVRVGEKAPFVFTLSNVGTADASNVFIRSILPSGFRHPAANEKNDIEYEVGPLKRGESRQVELTLLAVSAGDYQNHAILSADGDVSVESHHPVAVIPSRLKISREGPTNRFVGREARFTSTLTNESREMLQNVIVTETVPSGLKFVSASDGGSFNAQQRTVTWQIRTFEPGGARRFETVCLADLPGRLETSIQARDQRGDLAEATSQTTVAGFSSLTVDVVNPGRPIPVGEELALRLKVRNGGTAVASQVQTSIELPSELRFISVRGPVSYSQQGTRIVFQPIDQIDIQTEQTFDIVLAAAQATEDARVVVQLTSNELAKPLSEEESVVIFAEGE